jgi:predicted AAA+ superfamily ATPase
LKKNYPNIFVLGKVLEVDIPIHYKIEKVQEFKLMAYHLLTNSSSFFELQNIGRELGLSKATVEKYFLYLKNAYIIDVLYKYSKSSVQKGRSLKKAYAGSTNFITAINNYQCHYYDEFPEIFGKIIETYVWQRLTKLFEKVSFWRKGKNEIDFLVNDHSLPTNTLLIEVKFKNTIRYKEIKYLLAHAAEINSKTVIVITKSTLELKKNSGIDTYFIPYYLL